MSDMPRPYRLNQSEDEDEKHHHPYRRPRQPPPPGYSFGPSGINLSNMMKGPTNTYAVTPQGVSGGRPSSSSSRPSSTVTSYSEPGPSWSVPYSSMNIPNSFFHPHNVLRVPNQSESSPTSGDSRNEDSQFVVLRVPNQSESFPASGDSRNEDSQFVVPASLKKRTCRKSRKTTTKSAKRGHKKQKIVNTQEYYLKVRSRVDVTKDNSEPEQVPDSYNEETVSEEKYTPQPPVSEPDEIQEDEESDNQKSSATSSASSADEQSDKEEDVDTKKPRKKARDSETETTSQTQNNDSSTRENEESAERFGSFLASHLKNLTPSDRIKAEIQLLECLNKIRMQSAATDDEKKFVKNKEIEKQEPIIEKQEPIIEKQEPIIEKQEPIIEKQEPIIEKQEPIIEKQEPIDSINLETPTNSPQYEPLALPEPIPLPSEQEQYTLQSHPLESFIKQQSQQMPFPQQIPHPPSTMHLASQFMQQPYMPSSVPKTTTSDRLSNFNRGCSESAATAMAAAAAAALWGESWRQSEANPQRRPQGRLIPAPNHFSMQHGYTPLFDTNGQIYHSNGTKLIPGDFDIKDFFIGY